MRCGDFATIASLFATSLFSGCSSPIPDPEPTEQVDNEDSDRYERIVRDLMRRDKQASMEPLQRLLLNEEGQVRNDVLSAIQDVIAQEECTAGFREAAFDVLATMVDRDKDSIFKDVPTCLLAIDTDKASALLLSDRYFHTDSPNLHDILEALHRKRVLIPEDRLVPLLSALSSEWNAYPKSYAYGYGLRNLARTGSPSARAMIEEAMAVQDPAEEAHTGRSSTASTVRELAADAWCDLHGIEEPFTAVCRRIADWDNLEHSIEQLSPPQKLVFYVRTMRNDVNNGGFTCYFNDSCGRYAREAVAGLETLQATRAATILKRAMRVLGPEGPARDDGRRIDQVAALSAEEFEQLEELDSEFYADEDHLYVKLAIYAAEHAERFRPVEQQAEVIKSGP